MLMVGGGGGLIIDICGGGRRKKESPDFRFPEVGISGLCTTTSANTLIAVVHLTINIFRHVNYQHLLVIFTALLMTHFTTNDTLHK